MPTREQVEKLTNQIVKQNQQHGRSVSREQVRKEVAKQAQIIENRKQK